MSILRDQDVTNSTTRTKAWASATIAEDTVHELYFKGYNYNPPDLDILRGPTTTGNIKKGVNGVDLSTNSGQYGGVAGTSLRGQAPAAGSQTLLGSFAWVLGNSGNTEAADRSWATDGTGLKMKNTFTKYNSGNKSIKNPLFAFGGYQASGGPVRGYDDENRYEITNFNTTLGFVMDGGDFNKTFPDTEEGRAEAAAHPQNFDQSGDGLLIIDFADFNMAADDFMTGVAFVVGGGKEAIGSKTWISHTGLRGLAGMANESENEYRDETAGTALLATTLT